MSIAAGIFLVAHGLVHVAIWVPRAAPDAPFDPAHSWVVKRDVSGLSKTIALGACTLLSASGVLVLLGTGLGSLFAVIGAAASLLLILLTFDRWLLFAVAIDLTIIAVAVTGVSISPLSA